MPPSTRLLCSPSSLRRLPLPFLLPSQTRCYATPQKKPPSNASTRKSKPSRTRFHQYSLQDADQFSLVDALRYIRAIEVGQNPVSVKYDLAVKLNTEKNGPTVKNRLQLPIPVKTDLRICVIAEGKPAETARKLGAVVVGTEEVFEQIRAGKINFDKCIAHEDSFLLMSKAKLGPILGPKGLMPNTKFGTVVSDVSKAMRGMVGKSDYRERQGVIRMAVGQLGFTDGQLQKNIVAFMDSIKKDLGVLSHRTEKSISEVVLSSTNGCGFSLNGEFKSSVPLKSEEAPMEESRESSGVEMSAVS